MSSLPYTLWIPASFYSAEAESGTTGGNMLKSVVETFNSMFFRHKDDGRKMKDS